MIIVTPYRDRREHLSKWLRHYEGYDLWVIEQDGDEPFNKGALYNAFFALEGHKHDYCIYHDVDYRLIEYRSPKDIFSIPINPTHLAAYSTLSGNTHQKDMNKWREAYKTFFGGVIALTKEHVASVNGWTNKMVNWSPEDDEIRKRLVEKWPIDRRAGYFVAEDHNRNIDGESMRVSKAILSGDRPLDDGLSCIKYDIKSIEKTDKCTRVCVSLQV